MKIQHFQELLVWQKSHKFVLEIYEITKIFPKDERFGLTSQIRRSASSICANLAEGFIKSTKDFIRFIDIAKGSLEETKYHLILSKDLNYLNNNKYERLVNLSDEIGRMLNGLSKTLRTKIKC